MQYVEFEKDRKFDLILVGRIAIDFNPLDYFKPLSESKEYRKYLGGSPANVAVGLARLGKRVGFIGKVSDDQFGDYVTDFFAKEGIDVSRVTRAANGEKLGLTFTEILSPTLTKSTLQVQRRCLFPALRLRKVRRERRVSKLCSLQKKTTSK